MLSLKGKTAIDRDARTRKMFIKWRTEIPPQIISLDRLGHILWFVFCVLNGHSYDDLHKPYTTFGKIGTGRHPAKSTNTSSARTPRVTRTKRILAAIIEHFDENNREE